MKHKKEKLSARIRYAFNRSRKKPGFTLIETLFFIFIFAIVTTTFYSVFTLGMKYIIDAKVHLVADALVNERMEIMHNLSYANIGTESGIPSGVIPEREVVTRSDRSFYIFTFVQYVDDPLDGTQGGSPDDATPNDYKRVRVKVAWEDDENSPNSVVLVSNFAPPKKETPTGGGTLSVNVLNKDGHGVAQANVHIVNSGKGVNINSMTDSTGNLTFPSAPADGQNYQISVTKNGYYSVQTYPPYPITPDFDPVDEHAAVTAGLLNVFAIITDRAVNFNILTLDPFGNSLADIDYNLKGGRKKGDTVPIASDPIYDFDDDYNSGSQGKNEFNDRSYGAYTFTPSTSQYEFIKLDNSASTPGSFEVQPGDDLEIKAIFADKNINSLIAIVKTATDSMPIEEASVRLKNDTLGYDVTLTTDKFGKVYFPAALPELTAGDYDLTVSASGYQDDTQTINITDLIIKEISLNAA
jgi:hypothetical protein